MSSERASVVSKVTAPVVLTGTDALPLDTPVRPYTGLYVSLFVLCCVCCIYEFQNNSSLGISYFQVRGLRFSREKTKNSSEVSFHSSEVLFRGSVENFHFLTGYCGFPPWRSLGTVSRCRL